jgi:transcriptional regulator with XRE-family HTH domain
LATEIRNRRQARGLSQQQVAVLVGYTRQYIGLAERDNGNLPSLELIRALDRHLDAHGQLTALRQQALLEQRGTRRTAEALLDDRPAHIGSFIDAPAGRYFAGTTITATTCSAADDGRIVVSIPQRKGRVILSCPGPAAGCSSAELTEATVNSCASAWTSG